MSEPSKEERIAELWRRGRSRWKLFQDQREVYDLIHGFLDDPETRYGQFYLDIARQWGKTFLGVLIADEVARRNADWFIRYISYSQKGLWKFVLPNMRQLLSDCPAELVPSWSQMDSAFRYPTGSEIHMAGANNGHEDDSRGQKANLVIIEEAGFVDRLDYLAKSVAIPQLTTTGGRILYISTPPETPGHEAEGIKLACESAGRYVKRTIDQNTHLSEPAKASLIAELGGREATQARRELWCEWVVDEARAAVPEFDKHQKAVIVEPAPPTHFYPLVSLDVGFEDPTFALFGYWDFARAKLCIQDERYLLRATTDAVAAAVKQAEGALWPWATKESQRDDTGRYVHENWRTQRRATRRHSDVDLRLIADLQSLHDLPFSATAKDMKEAQVNELRMFVKDERVEIHPRCAHLIRHLKTTIWNRQRTQWERTVDGHGDGVDALLYMLRNAPRSLNPFPPKYSELDPRTHFIPEPEPGSQAKSPLGRAVLARLKRTS